MNQDKFPILG